MNMSSRVLVVLCATEERPGLQRTTDSLQRYGLRYHIYGMGKLWQGNGMKQVAVLDAATHFQGTFDFILSLDAFDVLCVAKAEEIVEKFLAFQHPMVISAEMNCWPDWKQACRYPPARTSSPFRFLNGGAYMAQTDYLLAMMTRWGITKDFRVDSDQGFLTQMYLKYPGCMMIDESCVLFQSLCDLSPSDFARSGRRVVNETTHQLPCILHGNGRMDMEWYWEMIQ